MATKAILTIIETRENHSWTSMTEILPQIRRDWSMAFEELGHEINIVDADQIEAKDMALIAFKSDIILFTAFNVKIAQIFNFIRTSINPDIPIGLYLHGLASVAAWPLYKWSWFKNMQMRDFFIVTSDADLRAMELACDEAKIYNEGFIKLHIKNTYFN